MGQKVHPRGLRLGIIETWDSRWYAEKDYAAFLHEDLKLRDMVSLWNFRGERRPATGKVLKRMQRENRRFSGISNVEIERKAKNVTIFISTARPGIVIGQQGKSIEALTKHLRKVTGKSVDIKIRPIDAPDLDSFLVGEQIATMLERRFAVRRAVRQTAEKVMRAGAEGVRICVSGRLGGAEIARTDWVRRGRVPLHTLRADIDYAVTAAYTTYGKIGIKVWIFKGLKPLRKKDHVAALAAD